LFFAAGVIVSVFVGCAIHYAVERPVTRYLNKRLRAPSEKVALPVAATVA
jgi:exopolysaccharide production protein ExoZ